MQRKIDAENELRKLALEKNVVDLSAGDPWDNIAKTVSEWAPYYVAHDLFEGGEAVACTVMNRARAIVRYAVETSKPDAERSAGYKEIALEERRKELAETLKRDDADIEALKLGDNLSMLYELSRPAEGGRSLGAVLVPQATLDAIYDGKSPSARATDVVLNTKLGDSEYRKSLIDGGLDAVKASDDPAIKLALAIYPIASDLRDMYSAAIRKTTGRFAPSRHTSKARSTMLANTISSIPSTSRSRGSTRKKKDARLLTRPSTSSPTKTSSAETPAVRASTRRAKSSGSSSTATSSRSS